MSSDPNALKNNEAGTRVAGRTFETPEGFREQALRAVKTIAGQVALSLRRSNLKMGNAPQPSNVSCPHPHVTLE